MAQSAKISCSGKCCFPCLPHLSRNNKRTPEMAPKNENQEPLIAYSDTHRNGFGKPGTYYVDCQSQMIVYGGPKDIFRYSPSQLQTQGLVKVVILDPKAGQKS
ncbi:MAG: hypothetical protein WC860_01220 [Candidatus Margulisiibacteriota bacterium]|jgi:hypothetical protein